MNPLLQMLYMSFTVLIHYQVFTICLIGIVGYYSIWSTPQVMIRMVIAFCISLSILVGITMGIVESLYPKETSGNVEAVIIKEVTEWDQ